jgi:multiple sugar transport system substrate-binding protein
MAPLSPSDDAPRGRRYGWALPAVLAAGVSAALVFLVLAGRAETGRLIYAGAGTVQSKGAAEKLVAEYNRTNPGPPVVFQHVSEPFAEKVMIQTVGGSAPDVFRIDAFQLVDWARRGALLDLTDLAGGDAGFSKEDFYPALMAINHHEGRLYGVPTGFSTLVLFYNKDLFDRAGIEYPDDSWDWDKFLAATRKMTLRDEQGRTVQFGCAMDNGLLVYAWQAGGRFYDERGGRCTFNSPETVRGLDFCWDLLIRYRVSPGFVESSVLKPNTRFATGRVPMMLSGCWSVPRLSLSKNLRWGVARLPRGPAGPVSGLLSSSVVASSSTRHPEAAWRFIRYLASREGQIAEAKDGTAIPAIRAVAESDAFLLDKTTYPMSDNRVFLDSMEKTYPWPLPPSPHVSLGAASRILTEEMSLLTQGSQGPEATAAAVERRVNAAIAAEAGSRQARPFAGSVAFWGLLLAVGAAVAFAGRAALRRRGRGG